MNAKEKEVPLLEKRIPRQIGRYYIYNEDDVLSALKELNSWIDNEIRFCSRKGNIKNNKYFLMHLNKFSRKVKECFGELSKEEEANK